MAGSARGGAAAGRGTVCFLNLGNVLAALTIISCEPLAGRLWQKRLVAAAAAAQVGRRGHGWPRGVAGSCCCLSKRVQTYLKIIKAHALEQRESTHRHTHTHVHYIYTCVCVYILVQAECKCAWRINLTWIKHLSRLMACGRTDAP